MNYYYYYKYLLEHNLVDMDSFEMKMMVGKLQIVVVVAVVDKVVIVVVVEVVVQVVNS
jgi:hypothetical protein